MQNATEALQDCGYNSIASLLDDLLKLDLVDHVNCRHMSIALLTHGERDSHLVKGKLFRRLLCKYASQVVDKELVALVNNPALRLPALNVNPEVLEKFDIKAIA